MWTARGHLPLSGRRALLAVLVLTALYAVLDVLVGARYSAQDAVLVWSSVISLAWQALLVLLVWRRRRWAWIVGAGWSAISASAAVAMVVDPVGVGGYDADLPPLFVLLQAGLLVAAAGLWFAPGVRPVEPRTATPVETDSVL